MGYFDSECVRFVILRRWPCGGPFEFHCNCQLNLNGKNSAADRNEWWALRQSTLIMPPPLIGGGISPRHTWLGHHFQGQKVKGQGQQAALLTPALTSQAAAAVSVGTYWPWEPTATLQSALYRRGRIDGARRFGAHRGRRGAWHIVAAARLQLVKIYIKTCTKITDGNLCVLLDTTSRV